MNYFDLAASLARMEQARLDPLSIRCHYCEGKGSYPVTDKADYTSVECDACKGSGEMSEPMEAPCRCPDPDRCRC